MLELILTNLFKDLNIEVDSGPEIKLFQRFQSVWPFLTKNTDSCVFHDCPGELTSLRDEAIAVLYKIKNDQQVREDYKQMMKLALLYIEGKPESSENLQTCGAMHKARWMSKILYAIKMILLEKEINKLPQGKVWSGKGTAQMDKLHEFVKFCVFVYAPFWFKAHSILYAPMNDLKLIESIKEYGAYNKAVSDSALKTLGRHLWYLTEEVVCLSLFDHRVPSSEKKEMVKKLRPFVSNTQLSNRKGEGFGKPTMPDINTVTNLSQLVGKDSFFIFEALELSIEFIDRPVEEWPTLESYKSDIERLKLLVGVNDVAERGVKLCADFKHAAKKEKNFQNVLQTVEVNRKDLGNLRCKKSIMKLALEKKNVT